jgi:hypothetical protein
LIELDASFVEKLYWEWGAIVGARGGIGGLGQAAPPTTDSGFCGFVLVPADPSLPWLLVRSEEVFVEHLGELKRLDDLDNHFYTRIYDEVQPLVGADVRAALPRTIPDVLEVTATIPPQQGAPGMWELANPDQINTSSTSIDILVTRVDCSGGETGEIMEPVASMGTDDIIVRADVLPNSEEFNTCQGNDSVAVTVALPEPIGNRILVDALCLGRENIRTSFCDTSGIRWAP